MDEILAWEKFKNSGKINDYLGYVQIKNGKAYDTGVDKNNVFKYGWSYINGEKYF